MTKFKCTKNEVRGRNLRSDRVIDRQNMPRMGKENETSYFLFKLDQVWCFKFSM